MNLNRKYIVEVLGVDIPLNESISLNKELRSKILYEHLLYESFLTSLKDFAKDKLNKVVDTIGDWKDAASIFSKVLSSKELLGDFTSPLFRLVKKHLQKLYEVLKKLKLDSLIKKIEGFVKKISSLDGWKKLFALIALGGAALYASTKLPLDGVKKFIIKTVGENFIENVTSKLTDWKSYIGYLGPIVGGVTIIYNLLKPLLQQFTQALKDPSIWATKLIKELKNKPLKIMKKSEFKKLIKENILSILEKEEEETSEVKIPSSLKPLLSKIAPDADTTKVPLALGKIAKGKEGNLSRIEKEILSNIFVSLIKTADVNDLNKFVAIIKQIK